MPTAYDGIQVNVCRNPICTSFGVPEIPLTRGKRPKGTLPVPGEYTKLGSARPDAPVFTCPCCKQHPPIRSNQGIAEEYARLSAYLDDASDPSCPTDTCTNYGIPLSTSPKAYVKFGTTAGGSIRWKCKACSKVFTQGTMPTKRQQITHRNKDLFEMLVNKVPMRRICKLTGLDPKVVYNKLDWINDQVRLFVGERERRLLNGAVPLPKMYVAVDRQQYIVNWSQRKDKRNVMLAAIASADLATGYVFGFHLNFDERLVREEVETDALAVRDTTLSPPYRKYSRIWLKADYITAAAQSKLSARRVAKAVTKSRVAGDVDAEIEGRYDENLVRADIEVNEDVSPELKLPDNGMQVHEQYTIYGHFLLLRKFLDRAPKIRFFLDQDPGFRGAVLSLFTDRIKARTTDAFYVSVLKDCTNDVKEKRVAESKRQFNLAKKQHVGLTDRQVAVEMMKQAMKSAKPIGKWGDTWVEHPLATKAEAEKKVCWLTNLKDYTEDHEAQLYLKASLHAVDRFFMQARRMLSLAERPIASASAARRTWHGYSPYNPAHLQKVLEIFRAHYNYCAVGADGETPAMRFGLAKGPVEVEKILGFDPMAKHREASRKLAAQRAVAAQNKAARAAQPSGDDEIEEDFVI